MASGNLSIQPVQSRLTPPAAQSAQAQAQRPNALQLPEGSADGALRAEDFTREQIAGVAEAFGDVVSIVNRGIRVEVDTSSHQVITQIIDRNTDEVIRQIPPEELLKVSKRLQQFIGNILDEQG